MGNILYTTKGCTRCKIVKNFLEQNGIPYIEKDIRGEGKEEFQDFYKANRNKIYRGSNGIEFPIFTNGIELRQGIGPSIAFLYGGKNLDKFFKIGVLHKEWVDGITISEGSSMYTEDFLWVLRHIKNNNMKIQLSTNGKNSEILKRVLDEKLADDVIMTILGPFNLYTAILGEATDIKDIERSIILLPKFPKYRFEVHINPIISNGTSSEVSYLSTDEMAEIANQVEKLTGTKRNPFFIIIPENMKNDVEIIKEYKLGSIFAYRTAARKHQVLAEIEKKSS